MTRVNSHGVKANATEPTPEDRAADAEILRRMQDGLRLLSNLESESGEWLNEEDMAKAGKLRAFLTAHIATYEAAGLHGLSGSDLEGDLNDMYRPSPDLHTGWNGNYIQEPNAQHEAYIGESYAGTISTILHGTPAQTRLALKLGEDQVKLEGKVWGNHLIFEITNRDGTKETWVMEDGLKNGVPIVIDAMKVKPDGSSVQGVTIDLSHILRLRPDTVPDRVMDFYVWGSDFNDDIKLSQGRNLAAGMLGDDTLRSGPLSRNQLFGDDKYETAGQFSSLGGNDTFIGGGSGTHIMGGDGKDQYLSSTRAGSISDVEQTPDQTASDIPQHDRYYNRAGTQGWTGAIENGMVVLRNTGGNGGGSIDIDMKELEAEGYRMAFAEARGNDIIITFASEDGSKTFRMKIEGILTMEDPVIVNVHGTDQNDILDFSRLDGDLLQMGHVFNLFGNGEDDIIFGVRHLLTQQGLDINDFNRVGGPMSQGIQSGELQDFEEDFVDEPEEGKIMFVVDSDSTNRQMTIRPGANFDNSTGEGFDVNEDSLVINAPEGYKAAYLIEDGGTGHYLVLVQPGEPAKTIVVHIDVGTRLKKDQIQIRQQSRDKNNALTQGDHVTPILLTTELIQNGFEISGGAGDDSIYYQEGSRLNRSGPEGNDTTEAYAEEEDVLEEEG